MINIYAVCASGIGTSLFARKLITDAIKEMNYDLNDFNISCIGMQEAVGTSADIFITGSTIANNLQRKPNTNIVVVKNMINDKKGMIEALEPVLEQYCREGKIHK